MLFRIDEDAIEACDVADNHTEIVDQLLGILEQKVKGNYFGSMIGPPRRRLRGASSEATTVLAMRCFCCRGWMSRAVMTRISMTGEQCGSTLLICDGNAHKRTQQTNAMLPVYYSFSFCTCTYFVFDLFAVVGHLYRVSILSQELYPLYITFSFSNSQRHVCSAARVQSAAFEKLQAGVTVPRVPR